MRVEIYSVLLSCLIPVFFRQFLRMKKYWFLFLALLMVSVCFSQGHNKIQLVQADELSYNKMLGEDVRRVKGNVVFEHDGAYLYCDSALLDEKNNNVTCFSRIHIKSSDTLNLYGDMLTYNGDTRIADITGKVKLVDNQTVLTTTHLIFDRNTQIAKYEIGGTIVNKENRLVSQVGYYYTDKKEFFFKTKVVLTNPDYVMNSDTLKYNTVSRTAFFFGPSTIKGKKNYIYCENGWYDTKNDVSRFSRKAYFINGNQLLRGDSLFYDRKNGIGKGFRNVSIKDTVQNIILKGNLGNYFEKAGFATMTDSAHAILIDKKDSLFLHSDTLKATFDSLRKTKALFAFHKAKFYRNDLQGMCDSLIYNMSDSLLSMLCHPVLWSQKNQLTADTIRILTKNKQVSELIMRNAAFIISRDTVKGFNQIKGKDMHGYFKDNELCKVIVEGNSETIYWVREDDGSLIGINKAVSSNMTIRIKENKVQRITYHGQTKANLNPEKDMQPLDLQLRDFKWLESDRPTKKEDIFK